MMQTKTIQVSPGVSRVVLYPGGPSIEAPRPGEQVRHFDSATGCMHHLIGPPAFTAPHSDARGIFPDRLGPVVPADGSGVVWTGNKADFTFSLGPSADDRYIKLHTEDPAATRGAESVGGSYARISTTSKGAAVQRNTFTFPFKGRDIAAAITGKIDLLLAKRCDVDCIDIDGLKTLLNDGIDYDKIRVRRTAEIDDEIDRWERERVGYAKASSRVFELDADDVAYFGLEA